LVLVIAGAVGFIGLFFWAGSHLNAARAEVEKGHNARALPHLKACLWLWPKNPEALLLSARTARRSGAFEQADDDLNRYEAVRGKDDPDLILERVLLVAQRGDCDQVRPFCEARVRDDSPDAPLVLEAQAAGLLRTWRFGEANHLIQVWLDRRGDDAHAYYYRGLAAEKQDHLSLAIDDYRKALDLDPDHDDARLQLARGLMQIHAEDKALKLLEQLQATLPENLTVPVLIAECRIQLNDAGRAKQLLDGVLARQPDHAEALYVRGKLALDDDELQKAEELLRKAVARDPSNYEARYQLSLCLPRRGKETEGREVEAALKALEEDMKEIQRIINEEMPNNSKDPVPCYRAGTIFLRYGAVEDARRWFQRAVDLDPEYAPAHKMLAEYYQRTGSPSRAAQERRLAGEH
jgi:tetratricopeptide (TPR) repeat protein